MKYLNFAIITALFIVLAACTEDASTNEVSETTPQQTATHKIIEPEGDIQSAVLNELQTGRWELVMFWATYCPVCKTDFEKLATFIADNPDLPLTVVGVVVDGDEEKEKALAQINNRELNYSHIIADFNRSNQVYKALTDSELIGVPSQLLYNKDNKLVGFNQNAIDIDALEIVVYDE